MTFNKCKNKTFIVIIQESYVAVNNIKISPSTKSVAASWDEAICANYYIMRVRKMEDLDKMNFFDAKPTDMLSEEIRTHEVSTEIEAVKDNTKEESSGQQMYTFTDDEDYSEDLTNNNISELSSFEGSGSGSITTPTYFKDNYNLNDGIDDIKIESSAETNMDDEDYIDDIGSGMEPAKSTTQTYFFEEETNDSFNLIADAEALKEFNDPHFTTIEDDEDYSEDQTESGSGKVPAHFNYDEDQLVKDSKITTPMYYYVDDVDEDYNNYINEDEEGLEYYDDYYEPNRKKRSLQESVELDSFFDVTVDDEPTKSIEELLALDDIDSDVNDPFEAKTKTVETNNGEVEGLNPCTDYILDIQTVYPHNIVVKSEEESFKTKCLVNCDISSIDFNLKLEADTNLLSVEVINEPNCVIQYAFKICQNVMDCDSLQSYVSTKSEITISKTFKPCIEYDIYILPIAEDNFRIDELEEKEFIKRSFNYENFNDPPVNISNFVQNLTSTSVMLQWEKPNDCVTGYSVTISELRHLPNLLSKYIDKESEPEVFHEKLSIKDQTFSVNNLSSCMWHKAEIQSLYKGNQECLTLFLFTFHIYLF